MRNGLALIVVDYLQRLTPTNPRAVRYEQIGEFSRGLKQLARELNVPVLTLCQLGRDAEKDERPRLGHLRESGDIEADADVVAFLTIQPLDGDLSPAERSRRPHNARLVVMKNRNGETGFFPLRWVPFRTRFEEVRNNYFEDN